MNQEQVAALRAPFPPEKIGKLPKAGRLLDFVGHAWVTERLLEVDPEWTYTIESVDKSGKNAVMFITLTVCGVTKPGVGITPSSKDDCEKELISDALKNGAMRFGVALELWGKLEQHSDGASRPSDSGSQQSSGGSSAGTGPGDCATCGQPIDGFPSATKKQGKWVHKAGCPSEAALTPAEAVGAVQDTFPGAEPVSYTEEEMEPF